jgi:hypothetical protein
VKQRTQNFHYGTALVVGLLAALGLFGFLWVKWPLIAGIGFAALLVVRGALDLRERKRLAHALRDSGEIRDRESGVFCGIYRPHWEVPHITVPALRTRWMFPLFESWLPGFPRDASVPNVVSDAGRTYFIRFRGRPSVRGSYGHFGSANRTVEITEIEEIREIDGIGAL